MSGGQEAIPDYCLVTISTMETGAVPGECSDRRQLSEATASTGAAAGSAGESGVALQPCRQPDGQVLNYKRVVSAVCMPGKVNTLQRLTLA